MSKKTPEINSGSMADISFLLLCFFLMVSNIDTDQGLTRKLPPPPDPNAPKPDVKERNVLKVLVNKSDRLLVQGQPIDIRQLKDKAKEFLTNPQNNPDLPEVEEVTINNLGTVRTTKGIISLKNDRGTSYDMYIQVQNELTAAINELRNELSQQRFGVKFADLTSDSQSEAIQKAIPIAISEAEPEDIGGKK
jgi:biopolymer transport protein ExbD